MGAKNARTKRKCSRKIQYETKSVAVNAAKSLRHKNKENSVGAYLCQYCSKWHVGHRPIRIQKRLIERSKKDA